MLAIDTSTEVCNLCLWENDTTVAEYASSSRITHTERLLPALDRLIQKSGWLKKDIGGIAVMTGPGSFTGLRIGISVAKGLAFGFGIPVIGGNVLEIVALQAGQEGLVCPAMDARRGEIFTALYRYRSARIEEILAPVSVRPSEWIALLPHEPIYFCGPATSLYPDLFQQQPASTILFSGFYLARTLAKWGCEKIEAGFGMDGTQLKASYLRPSDAEIHGPNPRKSLLKIKGR